MTSNSAPSADAAKDSASWGHRHAQLKELSALPVVLEAHHEALHAATLLSQTDENAAATCASHASSSKLVDSNIEEEQLGRRLDISNAILWSTQKGMSETNPTRLRAASSLRAMLASSLHDSSRDFISLNCLESNREGTVELVRSRFNKQIYVMKSMTKGAAKRGYRSNAPMTERRLLCAPHDSEKGRTRFTPACIAAFQSQASLHILMEYCPVGDLYHFLESAGQAPLPNEARNPSGGLLVERYVRSYATDIVAAVAWLHGQGYMHRDIKPGNFLFDRSGHLLLCDLASAAPFALFAEVPASANLPRMTLGAGSGMRTMKTNQRRVLYRHCCLIGTADYIAPEIFWAADLISRRKQRQYESYCSADSTLPDDRTIDDEGEDDDEPPPEGPGLYGPECDWWSVGVMLYEMVYKQLPFFSERIADTMEMIKHHQEHFAIDHRVACSDELKDLLAKLVSDADQRIGSISSLEVQHHPFFRGINWDKPWQSAPPFLPQVDVTSTSSSSTLGQPELSVLHSPRVRSDHQSCSYDAGPGNWSKIWSCNEADDFPAFPNSVEYSRAALQPSAVGDPIHGEYTRSLASSAQSASSAVDNRSFKIESRRSAMKQWSEFDPTWIGFSYVPGKNAFNVDDVAASSRFPSSPVVGKDSTLLMSDPPDIDVSSTSPAPRPPMTSTPPQSAKLADAASSSDIYRTVMRPRASLHRHAMQTASRMRTASGATATSQPANDGKFVTPVRKSSYSNLLLSGETPYPSSDGAPVPASPYPFPIAMSAQRPKKTPALPSTLRRNDLDRARSASAEAGEGSDSRCSGGSNAKREISEREAWRELKKAVMQSARKGGNKNDMFGGNNSDAGHTSAPDGDGEDKENDYDEDVNNSSAARMADETHVPAHIRRTAASREAGSARKAVSFLTQPASRPNLSRLLSEEGYPRRQPLAPILDTTPPHNHMDDLASTLSASASSLALSTDDEDDGNEQAPQKHSQATAYPTLLSENGLTAPVEKKTLLARRKSARQLLLKAQYRDTPTRIARTASPMLSTFSLDSNADDDPRQAATRRRSASVDGMESGREPMVTMKRLDSLPAALPMLPGAVQNLKRLDSRLMRRRDSHETLMQYRQGIVPDDDDDEGGRHGAAGSALQKERTQSVVVAAPVAVRPKTTPLVVARAAAPVVESANVATTAVARSTAGATSSAVAVVDATTLDEYSARFDRLQAHISLIEDRLQRLRARLD